MVGAVLTTIGYSSLVGHGDVANAKSDLEQSLRVYEQVELPHTLTFVVTNWVEHFFFAGGWPALALQVRWGGPRLTTRYSGAARTSSRPS